MKIFVSYQETGIDKKVLKNNLDYIRDIISSIWHTSFIYYLDVSSENETRKEIVSKIKNEISTSDILITFINHSLVSEWMMQEVWIAYWLWKKVVSFIKKDLKDEYNLTYWSSTNTVFFDDVKELKELIKFNIPAIDY